MLETWQFRQAQLPTEYLILLHFSSTQLELIIGSADCQDRTEDTRASSALIWAFTYGPLKINLLSHSVNLHIAYLIHSRKYYIQVKTSFGNPGPLSLIFISATKMLVSASIKLLFQEANRCSNYYPFLRSPNPVPPPTPQINTYWIRSTCYF
jgi:hypothetical protein